MSRGRDRGLPRMTVEVFASGVQMGESPRWHHGRLWLCDWRANEVLRFEADGSRDVVASVPGLPVSIDWLPDGTLVVACSAGVLAGEELRPYGAAGRPWNEVV